MEILLFLYMFLFQDLFRDSCDILFQVFFLFHDIYHILELHFALQTLFFAEVLYFLNHYIYHRFSYDALVQHHFHDKFYIVLPFYILFLFLYQKLLLQELILDYISNQILDALLVLDYDFFHQKNFQKYLLNLQNQILQNR